MVSEVLEVRLENIASLRDDIFQDADFVIRLRFAFFHRNGVFGA